MVVVREVGPRDGLQNEQQVFPPKTRVELVRRLADAG
jgi:isopropylmalate/homocitrate/citramalate synthase